MAAVNDVAVSLSGGVVSIVDHQFPNSVEVTVQRTTPSSTPNTVQGGQTNVRLDTALLQSAGLQVTGSASTLTPASTYTVSYPIFSGTFRYDSSPFAARAGSIDHRGSFTFNNGQVIVSNLRIAFDTLRVTEANSGFYVVGTVEVNNDEAGPSALLGEGEVILFDVGNPQSLSATTTSLRLGEANLLVSPELVAALSAANVENSAAAGTDVGDVLIDGTSAAPSDCRVVVTGKNGTFVSGNRNRITFDSAGVRAIRAEPGGASDSISVTGVNLSRDLFIRTGPASDSVSVTNSRVRALDVDLGSGDDSISITDIITRGDQRFQGGSGFDTFRGRLFDLRASLFASFGEVDIQERRNDSGPV